MIEFYEDENVFYIKVFGKIEAGDFEDNIKVPADHIIAESGRIRGILIDTQDFEGWEDFPALMEHIGFIKELDDNVGKVAIVGDQTWQKLIPPIASLFLQPVVKLFNPEQKEEAEEWVKSW